MAVVIASGVRVDGVREVRGLDVGLRDDVVVWREFLQGLVARCVRGVKLVIAEQNDEWLVSAHRYMSETSLRKLFIQAAEDDMPVAGHDNFPGKRPFWPSSLST